MNLYPDPEESFFSTIKKSSFRIDIRLVYNFSGRKLSLSTIRTTIQ